MNFRIAPVLAVTATALIGIILAVLSTLIAVNQPWLGLTLSGNDLRTGLRVVSVAPDGPSQAVPAGFVIDRLEADGQGIALEPFDHTREADAAETYALFDRFLDRQGRIAGILASEQVDLVAPDGQRFTVSPAPHRPLGSLSVDFWVMMSVGLLSLVIGGWVWALRPRMAGARLLALSGVALVLSCYPAAVYMSRELALPEGLYRVLTTINPLGSLSFVFSMLALFLIYPRQLVSMRVVALIAAAGTALWIADTIRLDLLPPPTVSRHLSIAFTVVAALVAAAIQYWRSGGDPRTRAAILWFGLSLAVATAIYLMLFIAPIVVGYTFVAPASVAFALGLIVYAGLTLSILRFRLFDIDRLAFRVLFYVVGALAFVMLDLFLVTVVALDYVPAFGIALIAVVLLYLPLRDFLSRRLMPAQPGPHRFFEQVVDVALTPTATERDTRWRALLGDLFDPLSIEEMPELPRPAIDEDGLAMLVPGRAIVTPLRLGYAHGGRSLFTARDMELTSELSDMLFHAYESRRAHQRGIAEERARIASDAHDNIGAKLLSALHGKATEQKDAMIREALVDLRDIINATAGAPRTMEEALAELRLETAERLSVAGLDLHWTMDVATGRDLSPDAMHAVRSIIREAVSNIIRHAGAQAVRIAVDRADGEVRLAISDDGGGFDPAKVNGGMGLNSMQARIKALGGGFTVRPGPDGTSVTARLPVG